MGLKTVGPDGKGTYGALQAAPLSLTKDFGLSTTMTVAQQTAGIQAAINTCIAQGSALSLDYKQWSVNAALVINGPITIVGPCCWEVAGSAGTAIANVNIPNQMKGGAIIQTAVATDAIQITGIGQQVDLENFWIMFGGSATWVNTGHGVNATPTALFGKYDTGVWGSTWDRVKVWGHDGNHYAFNMINPIYGRMLGCRGYGGGFLHFVNSSAGAQYGNYLFEDIYGVVMIGGTAHGIYLDNTGAAPGDFITFGRYQIWVWSPAGSGGWGGTQPPGTAAPTSAQALATFTGTWINLEIGVPDFETNVGSQYNWPSGAGTDGAGAFGNSVPIVSTTTAANGTFGPLLANVTVTLQPTTAAEHLFWINANTKTIGRATSAGASQINSLASMPNVGGQTYAMATDGTYIYWAQYTAGTVGRAKLDGSSANASFVTGLTSPAGIAVDASYIYITNKFGGIVRAPITGGTATSLVSGAGAPGHPFGIAVDGTYIYWADQTNGNIGRALLNGTSPNATFITGGSGTTGIAVNGSNIFWTNQATNTVGTATLAGGSVNQSFITGANSPSGVTVTATSIFWTNAGNNTIGTATLAGGSVNQAFLAAGASAQPYAITTQTLAAAGASATLFAGGINASVFSVPAGAAATTVTLSAIVLSAQTAQLLSTNASIVQVASQATH